MSAATERLRSAPPRSWLFVPALRAPEWIPKATSSGADAIIVDLEDATAPDEKERAREVVRTLRLHEVERPSMFVRVNGAPREAMEADLAAAVEAGAAGVVIPKVEDPGVVVGAAWHGLGLVPMIESARGILRAPEIAAAHDQVVAVPFGSWDFVADIGATHAGDAIAYARAAIVVATAAAGVGAVDTPWLDLRDPEGAGRDAEHARRLGFVGKLAIHPAQVGPINAAFTPSDEEVARARGIVEALDRAVASGSGIATYEGRMIDRPLARAAQRILARAELSSRGP